MCNQTLCEVTALQIGFFDSGIGGTTVLHDARKALPDADCLYYADTDNVPYGTKSRQDVRSFVFGAADFLVHEGADALVVACNTATSVAIDDLRERYDLPIIGMEPAVKPAVDKHTDKRILVTATELTLKENKLKRLISKLDSEEFVDLLPLTELVRFAERFEFGDDAVLPYLRQVFAPYDFGKYGTVVLGCTHFIFYRPHIRKLLPPEIDIIDGNAGTVHHLKNLLEEKGLHTEAGKSGVRYYHSGREVTDPARLAAYASLLNMLDEYTV